MTLHTCATAQVLALSYLENLGISGFLNFTSEVSRYYEEKRTATLAALEEHLSSLATWTTPKVSVATRVLNRTQSAHTHKYSF